MKNISLKHSSIWIIYLLFVIANILCIGTIQSQAVTGIEAADRIILKIKAFKDPPKGYIDIQIRLIEIVLKAACDDKKSAAAVKIAIREAMSKEFIESQQLIRYR